MRLITASVLIATFSSGCYFYASDTSTRYDDDYYDDTYYDDNYYNFSPEVLDAEAGCYYDDYYADDIWYFDALVDDLDGAGDITQVWADVYDEYDGQLVESFELYRSNESMVWFSDWIGSSTYLDCFYSGYSVDIVAYDTFEDMDYITVIPYTY